MSKSAAYVSGAYPYTRCDFHLHSCCSSDSVADPDAVCQAAIRHGLDAIALTDHADCTDSGISFRSNLCNSFEEYEAIVSDLKRKYESSLRVFLGCEVGYRSDREDEIRAWVKGHPFEFVIGSVHDSPPLGWYDRSTGELLKTRPDLAKQSLLGYYAELERAAQSGLFTVIGHIDVYERCYPGGWPDIFSDRDLAAAVKSTVGSIARHSRMELNLDMLRRQGRLAWSALPLLTMYRDLGGKRPSLGTDAHAPDNVGLYMAEGELVVGQAGFSSPASWQEICVRT